jgi:hypothetical protein
MQPVKLKKTEKERVLSAFNPTTQAYRVIEYLSDKPRVSVAELNQKLSVGNIADIALKNNESLRAFKLAIGCSSPPVWYENQFHQTSFMHEWSLCRLSPEEMKLPTKGDNRPRVKDPALKKRKIIIIDSTKHGELKNIALTRTRSLSHRDSI